MLVEYQTGLVKELTTLAIRLEFQIRLKFQNGIGIQASTNGLVYRHITNQNYKFNPHKTKITA